MQTDNVPLLFFIFIWIYSGKCFCYSVEICIPCLCLHSTFLPQYPKICIKIWMIANLVCVDWHMVTAISHHDWARDVKGTKGIKDTDSHSGTGTPAEPRRVAGAAVCVCVCVCVCVRVQSAGYLYSGLAAADASESFCLCKQTSPTRGP